MAADQKAVVDLPDEYTEEWGDQFTLKAYEVAASRASEIAFDIEAELSGKKNPVHKKLLHDLGMMIGAVHLAARGAFIAIKDEGRTEAEIIEEITYGETGYPRRSDPSVLLTEIIVKREAIERMWARVEVLEKAEGDEAKAQFTQLMQDAGTAASELHELVLRSIANGHVPAQAAARAAVSEERFHIDALERVAGEGDQATIAASQADRLGEVQFVIERVIPEFDDMSPWGGALRGIAKELEAEIGPEDASDRTAR